MNKYCENKEKKKCDFFICTSFQLLVHAQSAPENNHKKHQSTNQCPTVVIFPLIFIKWMIKDEN